MESWTRTSRGVSSACQCRIWSRTGSVSGAAKTRSRSTTSPPRPRSVTVAGTAPSATRSVGATGSQRSHPLRRRSGRRERATRIEWETGPGAATAEAPRSGAAGTSTNPQPRTGNPKKKTKRKKKITKMKKMREGRKKQRVAEETQKLEIKARRRGIKKKTGAGNRRKNQKKECRRKKRSVKVLVIN